MKKISLKIIIPSLIVIVALIAFIVYMSFSKGINYEKLESDMTTYASKYYEKTQKNQVIFQGPSKIEQEITLKAIGEGGYDITAFTEANCDTTKSYVILSYDTDKDGKQKGEYKVANHLVCDDYKTK